MLKTRLVAISLVIAVLALPAAALAQSPGDQQYQDPLAGQQGSKSGRSSGSSSSAPSAPANSSGSSSNSSGTSGTQSSGSSDPQASSAGTSSSGRQLPRTGFELLIPIELGLAMVLTGVALHRYLVIRARR